MASPLSLVSSLPLYPIDKPIENEKESQQFFKDYTDFWDPLVAGKVHAIEAWAFMPLLDKDAIELFDNDKLASLLDSRVLESVSFSLSSLIQSHFEGVTKPLGINIYFSWEGPERDLRVGATIKSNDNDLAIKNKLIEKYLNRALSQREEPLFRCRKLIKSEMFDKGGGNVFINTESLDEIIHSFFSAMNQPDMVNKRQEYLLNKNLVAPKKISDNNVFKPTRF